jgi:hypothetical protein
MTDIAETRNGRGSTDIGEDLRMAIVAELSSRGLEDAENLAAALEVAPLTARLLLRSSSWSLEDASWVVSKLDLPVAVIVTRDGQRQ